MAHTQLNLFVIEKDEIEAEVFADFYLSRFHGKRLDDLPEFVPPLSGKLTRGDWVNRMKIMLDRFRRG